MLAAPARLSQSDTVIVHRIQELLMAKKGWSLSDIQRKITEEYGPEHGTLVIDYVLNYCRM